MNRKRLPILISLPHAGLEVPDEIADLCMLDAEAIKKDGDEGAFQIYSGLSQHVLGYVSSHVARAIVDMNRSEDDFRKDGVIKTHTCWDEPIYREPPSEQLMGQLIRSYHHKYHTELARLAELDDIVFGVDCHTMAASGPPVAPDPGQERPLVCLGNLHDKSCSPEHLRSLARCLELEFGCEVSLNRPFSGGFIVRHHSKTLPWVMIELSRTASVALSDKADAIKRGLERWCAENKF